MIYHELHFLHPWVQAPPGQTPKPLPLFRFESILLTAAVEDGKTVGDLYPVSANKLSHKENLDERNVTYDCYITKNWKKKKIEQDLKLYHDD